METLTGEYPVSLTTVNIPKEGKLYFQLESARNTALTIADADAYVVFDGKTYESEEGVVTVQLPADKDNTPVSLQIGNHSKQAKAFALNLTAALGSQANPQVLESLDPIQLQLEENQVGGYYYLWKAAESGTLTLAVESIQPETAQCRITLACGEKTGTVNEDGAVSIDVENGDEVTICVTVTPEGQAAEVTIAGTFNANLGSLSNPMQILDAEQPYEAQVPAGGTVYYSGYLSGMCLTIENAADAYLIIDGESILPDEQGTITYTFPAADGMGRPSPVEFGLSNGSDADGVYTMTFAAPVGTLLNPAELMLGENTVTIAPENAEGYNYRWTATGNGKLTVTMSGSNWQYMISNETAGAYGDLCDASQDPTTLEAVVEVTEGDVISLMVNGFNAEDPWSYPGGTLSFTAAIDEIVGTEDSPIMIQDPSVPFTTEVPAGKMLYYAGYIHDMTMTAENVQGAAVILNNVTYAADANGLLVVKFPAAESVGRPAPVVFVLSNGTEQDAVYTLNFAYPVGSLDNPAELVLGENTATVEADKPEGYNFAWEAAEPGTLTVTMEGSNWQYVINNETAGFYGDLCDASQDPSTAQVTLEVAAGDRISLNVNGFDPDDVWSYPGGTITFTAAFESAMGTQTNPILNYGQFPIVTDTIPAGGSLYYQVYGAAGMELTVEDADAQLTVDGEAFTCGSVIPGDPRNPVLLGITNQGTVPKVFTLHVNYPLGSFNNPAALNIGENKASVDANSADGYNYTWEATGNGLLTLTMNSTDWQYTMNNETTGAYGSAHWSDEDPKVSAETIQVHVGDKISVNVNTYTPGEWDTPAGTVAFTASFAEGSGTEAEPIVAHATSIVTPAMEGGQTLHYTLYGVGGMVLEAVEETAAITVGGSNYVPGSTISGTPRQSVSLTITNNSEREAVFTLNFSYPLGSLSNPDTLVLGENTAVVAANSADGYIYNWTAAEDGVLTITMSGSNWQYVVNNETSGLYGDFYDASQDPSTAETSVKVTAGDKITVNVNGFDPQNVWNYPGGTIVFNASFITAAEAEPKPGSQEKPIEVHGEFPIVTPEIAPGETLYYSVTGATGAIMTVSDEDASVTVDGQAYTGSAIGGSPKQPVIIAVTNHGADAKAVTLSFAVISGTVDNPAKLEMGEHVVTIGADGQPYYYTWTAEQAGKLSINIVDAPNGWQYQIDNQTTGAMGELYDHDYSPQATSCEVTVAAGDKLVLMIATFDPENWSAAPAGALTFTAAFAQEENTPATEETPVSVSESAKEEPTAEQVEKTEGKTEVASAETEPAGSSWETAQEAKELKNGTPMEVTVEIPAGSNGCYFRIPVTSHRASVKITMDEASKSWQYQLMTLKSDGKGSVEEVLEGLHKSSDEKPVTEETFLYTDGSDVYVILNTADGSEGTVTFTVTYTEEETVSVKQTKAAEPVEAAEASEKPQEPEVPVEQETVETEAAEALGEPQQNVEASEPEETE